MKKKSLKSLSLNKKSISNLSSLESINGAGFSILGVCNETQADDCTRPLTPSGQVTCQANCHIIIPPPPPTTTSSVETPSYSCTWLFPC